MKTTAEGYTREAIRPNELVPYAIKVNEIIMSSVWPSVMLYILELRVGVEG